MKKLCILIALFVNFQIHAQQRFDFKIKVDTIRDFVLQKPSGQPPAGGYPLVVMLHGTNQTGDIAYNYAKWNPVGEREKIIIVYPTARKYCTLDDGVVTKWSNAETFTKLCPGQKKYDDVAFLRKMIDTIGKTVPLNSNMIFCTGFSSGGVMTSALSVKMNDVFKAIGNCAGFLNQGDTANMNYNMPTWAMIGTEDNHFKQSSWGKAAPFNDTILAILQKNINNHLYSCGLKQNYTKDSLGFVLNYNFTTPVSGESGGYFRFTVFNKLEHFYPNGVNYLPGNPNSPVAAELYWDFFKKVASGKLTTRRPEKENQVKVYPNPASKSINIKVKNWNSSTTVMLLNSCGQTIKNVKMEAEVLNLDLCPFDNGIYTIRICTDGLSSYKKIVLQNK